MSLVEHLEIDNVHEDHQKWQEEKRESKLPPEERSIIQCLEDQREELTEVEISNSVQYTIIEVRRSLDRLLSESNLLYQRDALPFERDMDYRKLYGLSSREFMENNY